MTHDALDTPIILGETVTIGDREVCALRQIGLKPIGDGTVAVTLTLLTDTLHIDWHEINPGVEFIAPEEILTQLGKPEPEVEA